MHYPIFNDILFIFGFSVVIVFILQRLRLPSILGFLLTGILIGPHALSLVNAIEDVELLSEIGVILLLFVIGMELSIKNLVTIKKTVFIGGSLQVLISIVVTATLAFALGYDWSSAFFIGFLFSLSSTAIVLKILQDHNELSAPHGRNALGILIFQDIIVVPMILLTPILAGQGGDLFSGIILLLLKTGGVILITYVGAKYLVPHALDAVARTNNRELFLLSTIALCMLVAFITSQAGLSLALGAFLAGLIISESDYSHQATSAILPFRELFISFFFISIGMLLDLQFFFNHLGLIVLILLGVFLLKSIITATAVAVLGYPPRTYLLSGLSLFQIGEFSFILSKSGVQYGLLNEISNQYFLAVSILSMLLTPFVIIFSEKMANRLFRIRLIKFFLRRQRRSSALRHNPRHKLPFNNHLIIIGYGVNGHHLAQAARYKKIPYIVVELNAQTVQEEKAKGVPIIFGDATHEHILESVHISSARAVMVAISDHHATRIIVSQIRVLCPTVYVLARVRYVKDMKDILALGADEVIPEEFETSIQVFSRVLNSFLIPEDDIEEFIETLRTDNYQLFQSRRTPKTFRPAQLPNFNITCLRVNSDSGGIIGKPLNEVNIRKNYKINILGISRNNKMLDHIDPGEMLCPDDILYVHGRPEHINRFQTLIN